MRRNSMNQPPEKSISELRIVLLGKTGSGKSSTGNAILSRECFEKATSPESVTKHCERKELKTYNQIISVIDTPGLFDTKMTEQNMKEEIEQCIVMSAPGPHAFLLLIKVGRFTEEEKNTVKWIKKNFGEKATRHTIILFTHADALEDHKLEDYIRKSNDLQVLVDECGGRFHSFNNKITENNHSQVTELLKKIDEMVAKNGGQCYSDEDYQYNQSRILDKKQFWSGKPRIALLGKTGSGKTSTAETIVGQKCFTKTWEKKETCVNGKKMKIIDTPGLTDEPEEKTANEIEKLVHMSAPGPHVFLLVVSLEETFTDDEKNTVKWIQENIGKDAARYIIILFTYADHLSGRPLAEYIRERKFLQSLVSSCGGRYVSFNNEDRVDRNQVTDLLKKIEKMAESNGWRYYTNERFQGILKSKRRILHNVTVGAGSVGAIALAGSIALKVQPSLLTTQNLLSLGGVCVVGAVVAKFFSMGKK